MHEVLRYCTALIILEDPSIFLVLFKSSFKDPRYLQRETERERELYPEAQRARPRSGMYYVSSVSMQLAHINRAIIDPYYDRS
jgi:hypothetical protein